MKNIIIISLLISVIQAGCQPDNNKFNEIKTESPVLVGKNKISTPLYERDMAISPGGNELIFTRGDYKQSKRCLVSIKNHNGKWEDAEVLDISGKYQDIEPFFSNNGNRLYFASNRPVYGDSTRSDYNIWYTDRVQDTWTEPVPLDSIINTRGDEYFPSLSSKGNLFFTATRANGIGTEDIFRSELINGRYQSPEPLPVEINTSFYEFNAFVSPDEDYIIFSSFGRDEGSGAGDLYVSEKDASGNWGKARNLGEKINSAGLDFCPFVDSDESSLYFTSERVYNNPDEIKSIKDLERYSANIENGFGNIYKIKFEELHIKR